MREWKYAFLLGKRTHLHEGNSFVVGLQLECCIQVNLPMVSAR